MPIHYVLPSGAGAQTGADWSNAYPGLPASLNRDEVYYIGDGSYSSYTFDDALSGTTKIYVVKATESDHGTDTGWSTTYGDGQASFGDLTLQTGYLMFHGQTRTEAPFAAPAGYGFRVGSFGSDTVNSQNGSGSYLAYCDIGGTWETNPSNATIDAYGRPVRFVYNQTDITLHRCAIHNGKDALAFAHSSDGFVYEYCDFAYGWGKEAISAASAGWSNLIARYCTFWNSSMKNPNDATSGTTAEIGAFGDGTTADGTEIYGNVLYNTNSTGRNSVIILGGVGTTGTADNCKVYNNTIVGMNEGSVYADITITGTGNEIRNTLFYDCVTNSVSASTTANTVVAVSDPFVNYAGLDFHLSGAQAGGSISSPYNKDRDGVTRGGDGTFDAGAFEYQA